MSSDIDVAFDTARELGILVAERDCGHDYAWDGKTMALFCDGVKRSASTLFHEIAHYQCAHPSRRSIPEFGLGTAPDSSKHAKYKKSLDATKEECAASLLGIAWELEHGVGKRGENWANTLDLHNWGETIFDVGPGSPQRYLRWLHRHGLLSDGRPQLVLRTHR